MPTKLATKLGNEHWDIAGRLYHERIVDGSVWLFPCAVGRCSCTTWN